MNADINRLQHMLDACEKIIKFTDVEYAAYEDSDEKQADVARYFEILGEASGRISPELKSQYPDIPWKITVSLRNILIHNYIKVDYDELWKTAKEDIPLLLTQVQNILRNIYP